MIDTEEVKRRKIEKIVYLCRKEKKAGYEIDTEISKQGVQEEKGTIKKDR